MKPTDHFVGRVYEWPVSKEQFNHLLYQINDIQRQDKIWQNVIDKLNARIEELEKELDNRKPGWSWVGTQE